MGQAILYYATLALEALVGVFGLRLYQEPPYDIVDHLDSGLEIRQYAPRLAAEVELPVAGGSGRDEAFRLLFAYIAGANRASASQGARIAMTMPVEVSDKQRIAMTVPVQTGEGSDTVRMRFFLPQNTPATARQSPLTSAYDSSQSRMRRLRSYDFPDRAEMMHGVKPI